MFKLAPRLQAELPRVPVFPGLGRRGRRLKLCARRLGLLLVLGLVARPVRATYVNFESSQVHPIALTPSGARLVVVNTPDARLEVFGVAADGSLTRDSSIPVGLEPVSVATRLNAVNNHEEAWVVNQ